MMTRFMNDESSDRNPNFPLLVLVYRDHQRRSQQYHGTAVCSSGQVYN